MTQPFDETVEYTGSNEPNEYADFNEQAEYRSFGEMLNGLYHLYPDRIAVRFRDCVKPASEMDQSSKNAGKSAGGKTDLRLSMKQPDMIKDIFYRKLIEETACVYYYFEAMGLKNQNIGILSENRYEYITVYLSSVMRNQAAPIDRELSVETIDALLTRYNIGVLFYSNKTSKKALAAAGNKKILLFNLDGDYGRLMKEPENASQHKPVNLRQEKPQPENAQQLTEGFLREILNTDKNRFAILAFTSGTSGESFIKGVMLSQYNILSNLTGALKHHKLHGSTLLMLPMNHTFGMNHCVLTPLYNGDTVCISRSLKQLSGDFKEFDPYYIGVVPLLAEGIYNNLVKELTIRKKISLLRRMIRISNWLRKCGIDCRHFLYGKLINKSLRIMVCGGAELNHDYVKKYEELGICLLDGYGLTELSPMVSANREGDMRFGSVGVVIAGDRVQIADDGEILVNGPNCMLGYYQDEAATNAAFESGENVAIDIAVEPGDDVPCKSGVPKGENCKISNNMERSNAFFKTGDIGYMKDGYLYVTGRKKNLITLKNGKKISPEYLESRINAFSGVAECLVSTYAQKENNFLYAQILLREGSTFSDEMMDEMNRELPEYMRIMRYEIVDTPFARTASGKLIRNT